MYLIDTNVLIRAIAGREPDAAFLKRAIERDTVALSVITVAEFLTKASRKEQGVLEKLIKTFPLLAIDERVAREAAASRKRLLKESKGKLLDHMMAAQAQVHNLILVTNNQEDFSTKEIKVISP